MVKSRFARRHKSEPSKPCQWVDSLLCGISSGTPVLSKGFVAIGVRNSVGTSPVSKISWSQNPVTFAAALQKVLRNAVTTASAVVRTNASVSKNLWESRKMAVSLLILLQLHLLHCWRVLASNLALPDRAMTKTAALLFVPRTRLVAIRHGTNVVWNSHALIPIATPVGVISNVRIQPIHRHHHRPVPFKTARSVVTVEWTIAVLGLWNVHVRAKQIQHTFAVSIPIQFGIPWPTTLVPKSVRVNSRKVTSAVMMVLMRHAQGIYNVRVQAKQTQHTSAVWIRTMFSTRPIQTLEARSAPKSMSVQLVETIVRSMQSASTQLAVSYVNATRATLEMV